MRYTSALGSQAGEEVAVAFKFLTGATVTIEVYNLNTQASVTLTSGTATEIGTTGYFVWESSDITTQPTDFTQYLAVATDDVGQTAAQKFVKGGFPDESAQLGFNGSVYIDTANGTSGTAFPIGTQRMPSDNITDARSIAVSNNLNIFNLTGSITLDAQSYAGYRFIGNNPLADTVNFGTATSTSGATFTILTLTGTQKANDISAQQVICNAVSDLSGVFIGSTFLFTNTLKPSTILGSSLFISCFSNFPSGLGNTIIDFNSTASSAAFLDYSGKFEVRNMTNASSILNVHANAGEIEIPSSNTDGTIHIEGSGHVTGAQDGGVTIENFMDAVQGARLTRNKIFPFIA